LISKKVNCYTSFLGAEEIPMSDTLSKHQLVTQIQAGLTEMGLITHTLTNEQTPQHIHLAHQILLTLQAQDTHTLSFRELSTRLNGKTPLLKRSLTVLEERHEIQRLTTGEPAMIFLTESGLTHATTLETIESALLRKATFIPNYLLRTLIEAIQATIKDLNQQHPEIFHYLCPNCTFYSTRQTHDHSTLHLCSYLDSVIHWSPPSNRAT